jgi:hypothetical protein
VFSKFDILQIGVVYSIPLFIVVIGALLKRDLDKIYMVLTPASMLLVVAVYWFEFYSTLFFATPPEQIFIVIPGIIISILAAVLYLFKFECERQKVELTLFVWMCLLFIFTVLHYYDFQTNNLLDFLSMGAIATFSLLLIANLLFSIPVTSQEDSKEGVVIEFERAYLFRKLISTSFLNKTITKGNFVLLVLCIGFLGAVYFIFHAGFLFTLFLAHSIGIMTFVPEIVRELD